MGNKATNAKEMAKRTQQLKKALLIALEKSLGVVTPACKNVGINRWTFYDWMKTDPEFKSQVQELKEVALDFAESHLHNQIRSDNPSATIFYLKTQGRSRGYIERLDIKDKNELDEHLEDMSNEEVLELIQNMTNKLNG